MMAVRQCEWSGTFRTTEEAARAYDTIAWRFDRTWSELNFPDVESVEEVKFLVPPTDPVA
jgi:hypothetical protein